MKSFRVGLVTIAALLASLVLGTAAFADGYSRPGVDVALLGGLHALNKNDSALPDQVLSVPVVLNVAYPLNQHFAVEGDYSWLIPMKQKVDLGSGGEVDRKGPDVLSYQASLRASLPQASWTPYLAAGVGAMTFWSNSDEADRVPVLSESRTMFALNFGAGSQVAFRGPWALRADFREFVAFPSKDAAEFSDTAGNTDPIWMERGTVGIAYRY